MGRERKRTELAEGRKRERKTTELAEGRTKARFFLVLALPFLEFSRILGIKSRIRERKKRWEEGKGEERKRDFEKLENKDGQKDSPRESKGMPMISCLIFDLDFGP